MERLGYANQGWAAQGGDWGADIVALLGRQAPKGLKSVHFSSIFFEPKVDSCPAKSAAMLMLTLDRKRLRSRFPTPWAKNEPCISKACAMLDTAGTLSSSQRDHKLWVMA